jgi:hypothetical protein
MLLTLRTIHKHPDKVQSFDLSFGREGADG